MEKVKPAGPRKLLANYLLTATDYLNRHPSNALRSYWNIICRDVLPSEKFPLREIETCQFCMAPWKYGDFTVRVSPAKKQGKKMKKILRKLDANKQLSPIQMKLAKAVHLGNTVVLKCHVCQKLSSFKLKKVGHIKYNIPFEEDVPKKDEKERKKKKKKKKKKSAFCGLNEEIMTQIHMSDENKSSKALCQSTADVEIIDEVTKVSNGVNLSPRKRKMTNDIVFDIDVRGKTKLRKMKEGPRIKANPLPIPPLGLQSAQAISNNESDDNFIPLESGKGTPKTNVKLKTPSQASIRSSNSKERSRFINPFSNEAQKQLQKSGNKKLNKWKKLIADEEKKPQKNTSLQDFLSAL